MTWNNSIVTGAIGLAIGVKVGAKVIKDITKLNLDSSDEERSSPSWRL
jgi:hypothetical protein